MSYQIAFADDARRSLRALDKPIKRRVQAAIEALADNPRPHGAKALQGDLSGLLRVRVGDYRVVYEVQDAVLVVLVLDVDHRRDVYR